MQSTVQRLIANLKEIDRVRRSTTVYTSVTDERSLVLQQLSGLLELIHSHSGIRTALTSPQLAYLNDLACESVIKRKLEALPIDTESSKTKVREAVYFVLVDGKWVPVAFGNEKVNGSIHYLETNIEAPDGTGCVWCCHWPTWAHCTADGKPCLDRD